MTQSAPSSDQSEPQAGEHVEQNPDKPTDQWVTGGEPATGPQQSYLHTLAQQAGEDEPDDLTKAQASDEIERLQNETGRG